MSNVVLRILSYLLTIPSEYSIIPHASDCLIFTAALSQGDCGACAAFAVSTLLAIRACLYETEDFIPSPYRIFDCANASCNGGLSVIHAASIANFGVGDIQESAQRFGLPCDLRWEHHARRASRLSISAIGMNDPIQIKVTLLLFGPILASGVATSHDVSVPDPSTGVYNHPIEHPYKHALVLVGWDSSSNWIVQNSWGTTWGDEYGRGRISHDVLLYAFDPIASTVLNVCSVAILICVLCAIVSSGVFKKWIH